MKKFLIYFLLLSLLPLNTFAKIAYIDLNFILNNSDVGKFVNLHIEKIKNENYSKYKQQENKLIEKEQLLISQKNILNEIEFNKKIVALTEEVKKYRSDKKDSIDKINKIKIEYTKEIIKSLNPIIAKYVNLNSISIVIPKKKHYCWKKKSRYNRPNNKAS